MDLSAAPGIAVIVVGWYVIIPWRVRQALQPQGAWDMEPFDPTRHRTSAQASAFLSNNVNQLIARGFRQAGDLVHRGPMSTTRVVLLTHPEDDMVATVVVVTGAHGSNATMVEFSAELVTGTVFDVNNSGLSSFAPTPDHVTYRFPDVRDAERLYLIARALLRRDFGSASLRRQDLSDPATFLKAATNREYQRQVGTGYFRFDVRTGRYATTLKGAYLMAWKLMFPFKSIRKALHARKARRVLREIGMDR